MRSTAVLAVLALSLTSGCYLGRTRSAKTSAYVLNSLIVTVAGAVALSGGNDHASNNNDDASGSFDLHLTPGATAKLGTIVAGAALLAIGATALAPTERDAPAPDPLEREGMRSTVTAPGLTPAIVQIR